MQKCPIHSLKFSFVFLYFLGSPSMFDICIQSLINLDSHLCKAYLRGIVLPNRELKRDLIHPITI